jgi:hypothetical protein
MKKFYVDHLGAFVLVALVAAGMGIYLSMKNQKDIRVLNRSLRGGSVETNKPESTSETPEQ